VGHGQPMSLAGERFLANHDLITGWRPWLGFCVDSRAVLHQAGIIRDIAVAQLTKGGCCFEFINRNPKNLIAANWYLCLSMKKRILRGGSRHPCYQNHDQRGTSRWLVGSDPVPRSEHQRIGRFGH
jgi:hypothetical protein